MRARIPRLGPPTSSMHGVRRAWSALDRETMITVKLRPFFLVGLHQSVRRCVDIFVRLQTPTRLDWSTTLSGLAYNLKNTGQTAVQTRFQFNTAWKIVYAPCTVPVLSYWWRPRLPAVSYQKNTTQKLLHREYQVCTRYVFNPVTSSIEITRKFLRKRL